MLQSSGLECGTRNWLSYMNRLQERWPCKGIMKQSPVQVESNDHHIVILS
jgi:hypothetical protein